MLQVFETTHGIKDRWTPDMAEWQTASQYFATREYQKALTHLEGLVISCLFELQKMGYQELVLFSLCVTVYGASLIILQDISYTHISINRSRCIARQFKGH